MRPVFATLLLTMAPALAQAEARTALIAPNASCEAPALVRTAERRQVSDSEALPPPFLLAVLSCAGEGAPKRPVRRA